MSNSKNDFPFLDILFEKEEVLKDFGRYKVQPDFGEGTVLIYTLFPGFYLAVSNFNLKNHFFYNPVNNQISRPFIKMEYCLSGEYRFRGTKGNIGVVEKGDCACYAGLDTFSEVEFRDGHCSLVGLFCYPDEFKITLKHDWGDSGAILDEYYRGIIKRKEYLITKWDLQSTNLLDEVRNFAARGDPVSLRLRTMELFMLEINLFLKNKKNKKKYYSRSHMDRVARIKKIIDENYYKNFTVEDLSARGGINSSYLKNIFRERYGNSIYSYKKSLRLSKAETMLIETELPVYEIVQAVGYADAGKFAKAFKEHYFLTPFEYRTRKRFDQCHPEK